MAVTPITPLPLPPTRQDPVNFAARADAFLAALPDFQVELNTLAAELDSIGINATQSEINAAQSASDAQDAANAAGAFANYKGLWSSLTGPLNKPASVKHSGKYWNLLNNLANVQSSEPGVSADWEESDLVRVTGANFTGPITVPSGGTGNQVPTTSDVELMLSDKADLVGADFVGPVTVPAGATGSQVPQSQEVVHLTGNESIGGVKTFTSSPKVPAGAASDEAVRASEAQWSEGVSVGASGTAVDITGIPANVNEIAIGYQGIGLPAAACGIQLGTSTGIQTTGYNSAFSSLSETAVASGNLFNIDKFRIRNSTTSASTVHGEVRLVRLSNNRWYINGVLSGSNARTVFAAGNVNLSGTLSRIRIFLDSGSFSAGTFYIRWRF